MRMCFVENHSLLLWLLP